MPCRLQCAQSVWQLMRARTCAIVSPKSANNAGLVFGNGWPVVVAPAFAALNRFERPCDWPFAGSWQPLHLSSSPGRTCSQLSCRGPMRRPLASRIVIANATLAGTFTLTEPSGSMGA
jgi:hypothetical protein